MEAADRALARFDGTVPQAEPFVPWEERQPRGTQAQVEIFGDGMQDFWRSGPEDSRHINRWLAENCFGDYYTRPALDLRCREMLTFCYLAAQGGCEPQLISHAAANLRMGQRCAVPDRGNFGLPALHRLSPLPERAAMCAQSGGTITVHPSGCRVFGGRFALRFGRRCAILGTKFSGEREVAMAQTLHCLIDLHLHLDGSLSAETARALAAMQGIELPRDAAELDRMLHCPAGCRDLNEYLACFTLPLSLLQTGMRCGRPPAVC